MRRPAKTSLKQDSHTPEYFKEPASHIFEINDGSAYLESGKGGRSTCSFPPGSLILILSCQRFECEAELCPRTKSSFDLQDTDGGRPAQLSWFKMLCSPLAGNGCNPHFLAYWDKIYLVPHFIPPKLITMPWRWLLSSFKTQCFQRIPKSSSRSFCHLRK